MSEALAVGLLVAFGVWGLLYALVAEVLDRTVWNHRRKLERTTNGRE